MSKFVKVFVRKSMILFSTKAIVSQIASALQQFYGKTCQDKEELERKLTKSKALVNKIAHLQTSGVNFTNVFARVFRAHFSYERLFLVTF